MSNLPKDQAKQVLGPPAAGSLCICPDVGWAIDCPAHVREEAIKLHVSWEREKARADRLEAWKALVEQGDWPGRLAAAQGSDSEAIRLLHSAVHVIAFYASLSPGMRLSSDGSLAKAWMDAHPTLPAEDEPRAAPSDPSDSAPLEGLKDLERVAAQLFCSACGEEPATWLAWWEGIGEYPVGEHCLVGNQLRSGATFRPLAPQAPSASAVPATQMGALRAAEAELAEARAAFDAAMNPPGVPGKMRETFIAFRKELAEARQSYVKAARERDEARDALKAMHRDCLSAWSPGNADAQRMPSASAVPATQMGAAAPWDPTRNSRGE